MTEERFPFDIKFEKALLHLLMTDSMLLVKASKYLKKEYFSTEVLQWIFRLLVEYYEKYNSTLTDLVIANEVLELDRTHKDIHLLEYTAAVTEIRQLKVNDKPYVIKKVEEFIKRNLFIRGFHRMKDEFNANKFDNSITTMQETFEDINQVRFEEANKTFFFEETKQREFKRSDRQQNTVMRFTSGILELDAKIAGGVGRGELAIVMADAGRGKSICLVNAGASSILSNLAKVLHINLEGKDNQVEDRYDARFLNTEYRKVVRNELPNDYQKFYSRYSNSLVIVNFHDKWDYTVLDIEQEIKILAADGFIPDVIIVDYGDLLCPRNKKTGNSYEDQREVYQDLKTLGNKYKAAVWSAAQCSRAPPGTDPLNDRNFYYTRRNQADSYAKVRIADILFTLNCTDEEKKENTMRIYLDKFRDDECGIKLHTRTNFKNMQFYVPNDAGWQRLNQAINTNA